MINAAANNVCYWHFSDIPPALTNVRFEGNNGHDADVTRCLLMTQSGRPMPSKGNTQLRKDPHG